MIKELFEIPEEATGKQKAWLKMCAAIPEVKAVMKDAVTVEDKELSVEAKELLDSI